jgi:hypothetical protein
MEELNHNKWSSSQKLSINLGRKIITDLSVGFKITETAKVVIGANIFDIYPDANLGPQTAIRPRLVSGAIDYNAPPSTIDLSNANQFAYSKTPLNLDKTEDSFCSFEL